MFADDFFNKRAYFVIWSCGIGDNTRTYGQAEINWLARSERHDFISNFDIHSSTRVVTKAELDRLRFAEHRVNG